jgi:catechol 2,3-dioxygenase-like lactoylglutathione lyase family enzyme
MLAYATVGSNNIDRAKAFYDDLLGLFGIGTLIEHPSGGRLYGKPGGTIFGVLVPYDGKPATVGNGSMVSFMLESPAAVDKFHAKVLQLGGSSEGDPGPRGHGGHGVYASYMRDLDGNKISAFTPLSPD